MDFDDKLIILSIYNSCIPCFRLSTIFPCFFASDSICETLATYERRIETYKLISKIKFDLITSVISPYDLIHLFDIYNLIYCHQRPLYTTFYTAPFLTGRQFSLFPNKEFY